jgi:hypothetical protein
MRHSTFKTETSARCHSIGDHFTQPGLAFMQVVRLFDPHQLLTFNNFAAIPGADNVNVRNEIAACLQTGCARSGTQRHSLGFLVCRQGPLPYIVCLSCMVPISSVDVERHLPTQT